MRLKSLRFIENEGTVQEWTLEGLVLGTKNLIVGKNSTGKSRTLNVIHALSRYLIGLQPPNGFGFWDVKFQHEEKIYEYVIRIEADQVVSEKLTIDDVVFLDRGAGGVGFIHTEKLDPPKLAQFQSPTTDFAVVSRRDSIQHSFLEPLYTWASSLRFYPFGTPLGKDLFIVIVPHGAKLDDRDSTAVVSIFRDGIAKFQNEFKKTLINDLALMGYFIDDIGISAPISIKFQGMPSEPICLYVKEKNLPGITDQFSMSQGMFRVLSLLIQVNYFQLKKIPASILIDDIGEGLDFERSCQLIKILREKSDKSDLQIVLATNDKFVMNNIPLEEWSILHREGNKVTVKNIHSNPELFEDFKFTGLSNFSLLEYDFLNQTKH